MSDLPGALHPRLSDEAAKVVLAGQNRARIYCHCCGQAVTTMPSTKPRWIICGRSQSTGPWSPAYRRIQARCSARNWSSNPYIREDHCCEGRPDTAHDGGRGSNRDGFGRHGRSSASSAWVPSQNNRVERVCPQMPAFYNASLIETALKLAGVFEEGCKLRSFHSA
jgi:hypothetical protein